MSKPIWHPFTTGALLLVFTVSAAGAAAGMFRKSQPERVQISPACHPTFGYHQTCWRRFPALPPCDHPACDRCDSCRTGSVDAGLPEIPAEGIELELPEPRREDSARNLQTAPQPLVPGTPHFEEPQPELQPQPVPTSNVLPSPDMSAGARYGHRFDGGAAVPFPAPLQPADISRSGNRYGSGPAGSTAWPQTKGPETEILMPDGHRTNTASWSPARFGAGGRYGAAAWNRPAGHSLVPLTAPSVRKLRPTHTGTTPAPHSAAWQTLRYPVRAAVPPESAASGRPDQNTIDMPAAPVLRLPGS